MIQDLRMPVSKFTANSSQIKNWRVSTVGEYIYNLRGKKVRDILVCYAYMYEKLSC